VDTVWATFPHFLTIASTEVIGTDICHSGSRIHPLGISDCPSPEAEKCLESREENLGNVSKAGKSFRKPPHATIYSGMERTSLRRHRHARNEDTLGKIQRERMRALRTVTESHDVSPHQ
jgi:hypothetical protein